MLSALAVSGYILPTPALQTRGGFSPPRATEPVLAKLARLAEVQAKARAALREQSDRFEALYEQAGRLAEAPDELTSLAEEVLVREHEAAGKLQPQIDKLRRNLATPKANADHPTIRGWRRLAEDSLEIAITWLELYQQLRLRLLKLASDRLSEAESGSPVFSDAAAADQYLRRLVSG